MPTAPVTGDELAARAADTVAVVVTQNRVELLERSLAVLAAQQPPLGHVVVVDNGADERVRALVEALPVPATWLPSRRNLGGAGGFAYGMLHALALGAAYVWLADDDGRPGSDTTLATLLRHVGEGRLAMASPAVVHEDLQQLAFPTRRALRRVTTVGELAAEGTAGVLEGFAALFNGALFTAACIEAVGVPDLRLFLRGDEIEMHRRLQRSGLRFGTVTDATYVHPSGAAEFHGPLGVVLPPDGAKRFYTFRNRGYLTNQPGKRLKRPLEYAVYTAFLLGAQRSPEQWAQWRRLMREGRKERFERYDARSE